MTSDVQRWADGAMYSAAPVPTSGPRVYLLSMNPDPLGSIAAACKMYKGEVVPDTALITEEERTEYLAQIRRTKLKAPFEFVKFHFLIEGVTRSFTHQLVRQRTAVYAQESLRFAVKEDMPVGLPPSLRSSKPISEEEYHSGLASQVDKMRYIWDSSVAYVGSSYNTLVNMGMPAEDARGLLPHNILTRVHYSTDLRALLDHAGNRLCTQAQFEWRQVFSEIVRAIRVTSMDTTPRALNPNPIWEANGFDKVWRSADLCELFKPVCYATGRCEFKANFDRPCRIRERVDAHERAGEGSESWEDIRPEEWLADPSAAR